MKSDRADKVLRTRQPSTPADDVTKAETGSGSANGKARQKRAVERETGWRPKENVLQVAAAIGRFEILGRAVEAAGLASKLSERGPFTLFAPTDQAFEKMPAAELNSLLADKTRLHKLLSYHIVPSAVRAPRRSAPSEITTLDGKPLALRVVAEDGGYEVGDARIVKTNMRASNGVVHAIDTVLTPAL